VRNNIFPAHAGNRFNDNHALVLLGFTEFHKPVDFADYRRILGAPGFKKLRYARKTTGNIAGLDYRTRYFRQKVASTHVLAVLDNNMGPDRYRVYA
jgi:hypothetical protein